MKFIITPKEQWDLVKPIWRVLLFTFIVQLIGGVISLLISPYGHPFLDFWYGGAILTFPGFLIGSIWHQYAAPSKLNNHKLAFCFIGLICFCLLLAALFFPLQQAASQMKGGI